ncbi:MAG: DUF2188 domain-containing protein, partial [Gemmatimonadota bacterium]
AKPEPSRNAYHVARDDDRWVVKAEGARRSVSRHKTKREAVQAGRARAAAEPPGKLVIHRADGTVEQVRSYEPSAE